MKTLNRPMFNWGGPVKEGIMHGIREPHVRGQIVGRAMPHIQRGWQAFKNIFGKTAPGTRTVPRQGPTYYPPTGRTLSSKGYPGGKITGTPQGPGSIEVTEQIFTPKPWAAATGKYLKGSPEYAIGKKIVEGRGLLGKPIKWAAKSPLISGGLIYSGGKWLWPDGTEATDAEVKNIQKPGGYPKGKGKGTGTPTGNAAAFAQAQREERLNKYLQMMGYDQSKKTAIADALIDASKIVSDRGTLDRKNITGELINPAIQAFSKRLDKPQQIREAVGLMAAKAEIEKDLEDPSIKALRLEQLKGLRGGFSKDIGDFILSAKGQKIKPEALKRYARAKADQHGLDFTVVTDEMITGVGEGATEDQVIQSVVKDDGVYMIGDALIQVTGGVPKRIA